MIELLDRLRTAVADRQLGFGLRGWIENDSDLKPLHGDPRFQAILDKA